MENDNQIKKMILSSKKAAAGDIQEIKNAEVITKDLFFEKMRSYVLHKFLLTEESCGYSDDFNELAEISLSNSMKISKELVKEFDLAKSCDGGTSVMAKKVLLFLAIQREFDIVIPAMESASTKSLNGIIELIWNEVKKGPYAVRIA